MADLKQQVLDRGADIARALLGEPERETAKEMIYFVPWRDDGSNPALFVLRDAGDGKPAGTWVDRGRGEGGSIIDLTARLAGIDGELKGERFIQVLHYCADSVGIAYEKNGSKKLNLQPKHVENTVKTPSDSKDTQPYTLEQLRRKGGKVDLYEYVHAITGAIDTAIEKVYTSVGKKAFYPYTIRSDGLYRQGGRPENPIIYAWPEIFDADEVVIVEGEKDANSLNALGIPACSWMGGSGRVGYTQFKELAGKKIVTIWTDKDGGGVECADKLENEILPALDPPIGEIRRLDPWEINGLSDGGDATDVCKEFKAEGLGRAGIAERVRDILTWAKPSIDEEEIRRGAAAEEVMAVVSDFVSGRKRIVAIPSYPDLSRQTKELFPGSHSILCGGQGRGKSLLAIQWLSDLFEANAPVACLMLENSREFHIMRSLAQRMRNPNINDYSKMRSHGEMLMHAMKVHAHWMGEFGKAIFASREIWPNKPSPSPKDCSDFVEQQAQLGKRFILVDSLSVAIAEKPWIDHAEYLYSVLNSAEKHNCSVMTVMHPRDPMKPPHEGNIAGGQALTKQSYSIFWLEAMDPEVVRLNCQGDRIRAECNRKLHIIKARNGSGAGKTIGCNFDINSLRIYEKGVIEKDK